MTGLHIRNRTESCPRSGLYGQSDPGARRYIWGHNRDLRAIQWAVLAKVWRHLTVAAGILVASLSMAYAEQGGRMEKAVTGQG
jgi:hypothetical protein